MANYIIGRNTIFQSLRSGKKIHQIIVNRNLKQDKKIMEIVEEARISNVPLMYVDSKELARKSSGEVHQGILAFVPAYRYAEIDDILNYAKERNEMPFILMLDEIEDPHNFGSLIRTSVAAGVHGIIIPQRKQVDVTSTVMKVSTGTADNIRIVKSSNLVQTVDKLKDQGLWVIGTHQHASEDFTKQDYNFPLVLVIGNEGKGINRLLRQKCDYLVHIPIATSVIDSLNASVAGAIIIFKILERRQCSEK